LALSTVNDVLFAALTRNNPKVIQFKDEAWNWTTLDSAEVGRRVRAFAAVLRGYGIGKGDRVAILSENRWEWAVADFATLALGAVDVPLYPTNTPEQLAFMLRDSGTRVIVLSSREQYNKVMEIREQTMVERIVVMDGVNLAGAQKFSDAMNAATPLTMAELEQSAGAVKADDLATIIYTSGTTGEPKGVMLTHGNIASNLNFSTTLFQWDSAASCVSFLPLSHITARHLDYAMYFYGACVAYCPDFAEVVRTFKEIRPTVVVAVPRVYEKVRQAVEGKVSESKLKKKIYDWAIAVGHKHVAEVLDGKQPRGLGYKLANKLIFSKVSEAFGGRAVHFISGGAPLGLDTAVWFGDVGIRIFEGYGLTETSPVISLNNTQDYRLGSVGKILPNLDICFAPDDEILVRGPSIFVGYWHNQKATDEAFSGDAVKCDDGSPGSPLAGYRWFHTGDIGHQDTEGFLYITDRKKELIKTSGGKFIAPALVENKIKGNILIGQAALVGDKRKFASMVISPNFAALETWAKANGIQFSDHAELVENPQVIAEYKRIVDKVNATLAQYETIKRFHLVPDEWTLETGEMTPSMKLKRRVINTKYHDVIEELYEDEATAHR
jgi:long-chain acyl-CoA synthetase